MNIPDCPVIANMERTGYPNGKEPQYPQCPVCGAESDTFYADRYGDVMGCDDCVEKRDAWEHMEETGW